MLSHLAMREAAEVGKRNRGPLFKGKPCQRVLDASRSLVLCQSGEWIDCVGTGMRKRPSRLGTAAANEIDLPRARDQHQPDFRTRPLGRVLRSGARTRGERSPARHLPHRRDVADHAAGSPGRAVSTGHRKAQMPDGRPRPSARSTPRREVRSGIHHRSSGFATWPRTTRSTSRKLHTAYECSISRNHCRRQMIHSEQKSCLIICEIVNPTAAS